MQRKIKYQFKTFRWAFIGIKTFFKSEVKAWIHSFVAVMATIVGFILKISGIEWALVTLVIGLVFICEIINTTIEELSGTVSDKYDALRGKVKDMAAGAVLISAIVALVVALIIFLPKILV